MYSPQILKHPYLERGSSCPGVFIVGLIDHSINFTHKVCCLKNYKEFRQQKVIELSLKDSWFVFNDPGYTQSNDKNI